MMATKPYGQKCYEINETQNCLATNILQITLTDHFIR